MYNDVKQVIISQIKEDIPPSGIESILICGSFKNHPSTQYYSHDNIDIDVICIVNSNYNKKRYFKIFLTKKLRIEMEFVPNAVLDLYLTNYWWWPHNWDIEMGKYFHSKILLDHNDVLWKFKNKLKNYPETIRAFLILYRLGKLLNLKNKLLRKRSQYLIMELIRIYLYLTYPIYRKYPKSIDMGGNSYVDLEYLTSLLSTKNEDKIPKIIMSELEEKLLPILQEDEFFLRTVESLPLHYPDEVYGKIYLNKFLQNKCSEDISLNLEPIGGDKND